MEKKPPKILALTLNPSIDHILITDSISLYNKNKVINSRIFYGGKGINAAFTLGKLGANCLALAILGKSEENFFCEKLHQVGVETNFILTPEETRHNYKIHDTRKGKDTEFNETGSRVTDHELSLISDLLDKAIEDSSWLILSGSLPPGIPEDYYQEFIKKAKEKKVLTCLDASGEALRTAVNARPDVLRINRSELEELCENKLINDDQVKYEINQIHRIGISRIVISSSAQSVIAFDGCEFWKVKAPKVVPVSLTGAGDAMTAALVYQLSEGKSFQESILFSTAVATASVLCEKPGDFLLGDFQRFIKEMDIQRIKCS